MLQAIETATVRNGNLRFIDGVKGWNADDMDELRPEVESALDYDSIPGPSIPVEDGIFSEIFASWMGTPNPWARQG